MELSELLLIPARHLVLALVGLAILGLGASRIRKLLARRRFARQHGCRPPARFRTADPILGLDMIRQQLRRAKEHKILETSAQRYEACGTTHSMDVLRKRIIFTTDPDNIKTVLSLKFDDFILGDRLKNFGPLLGTGIFDTDGQRWHNSRALIRPNFTREQVADLAAFEALIPDMLALIPRDGKTTVDLQEIFFRYTIDSATEFLFGQSVGSLKQDIIASGELSFAEAFNYSQDDIRIRNILGGLSKFYRDPKAKMCNKYCRDFAQQLVEKAVEAVEAEDEKGRHGDGDGKRAKYVFSRELARRTSDKLCILDEVMNVLLAGRDTTASLLSNMFFMLAKKPAIWAKLQAEVSSLDGRLPSYQELRNLRYLKCCMNESLRIHPVVPMNSRQATRDTVLPTGGGPDGQSPVFVPEGTRVSYNVYAMHRRKDFYGPDADEFRPERWEDGKLQPRWEYLPFNGGPRICVGQQYALTEVSYVTVRLLQEFSALQSRDPGPWEEKLTLTLSSRNGTQVCLTPRSGSGSGSAP